MLKLQFLRGITAAVIIAAAAWYSTAGVAAGGEQEKPSNRASQLDPRTRLDRCAVKDMPADQLALVEQTINASTGDSGGLVVVPVYWHIITTTKGAGDVSALVPAQMKVLNDAFGGANFAFELKGVQVVKNNAWFFSAIESPDEIAMKNALRKGGPETLNIYTTNGDVYLGWATFPLYYKFAPRFDGVVLWWAALPGTGLAATGVEEEPDGVLTYDGGDTGTHEVGHWLGLYHTFQFGCAHPGDSVKDTPFEAEPQFFCVQRDSCVGVPFPGDDPIMNFMDYVDDVCMDHFTPEQEKRMRKHWHAFRDKKERTR
jgi:hypothetical protein